MHLENTEERYTGRKGNIGQYNIKKERGSEVVDVYFEVSQKRIFFQNNSKFNIRLNEKVIVETQMGLAMGKVIAIKRNYINDMSEEPLKKIIRIATDSDLERNNELKEDAIKAGFIFKNKIKKYNLNIKLVTTEYTFDRKKLIFYFASEDRVDFRLLVKDLAAIFKVRIELRQIGVRDYAKIVGDCGSCGKTLCCKSFINKFDSVSIKMARSQGISVTPSKMTGICGRLKCCVGFENDQYAEVKDKFPVNGQNVKTPEGIGNVISMNMLNDIIFVNISGKGLYKYTLSDIEFNKTERDELEQKELQSYEEG